MKKDKIIVAAILALMGMEKGAAEPDGGADALKRRDSYQELRNLRRDRNEQKPISERQHYGKLMNDIQEPGESTKYVIQDDQYREERTKVLLDQLPLFKSRGTIDFEGEKYTYPEFVAQLIRINPKNVKFWMLLADSRLGGRSSISINGKDYSHSDVLAEVIKLDPKNIKAWKDIYHFARKNGVQINGRLYSEKDCLIEILKMDPTNSFYCEELAYLLRPGEKVLINERYYSEEDCWIQVAKSRGLGEKEYPFWKLSQLLGDRTIHINGKPYSAEDCCKTAVLDSIGEADEEVYSCLKPYLRKDEVIRGGLFYNENGATYTEYFLNDNGDVTFRYVKK